MAMVSIPHVPLFFGLSGIILETQYFIRTSMPHLVAKFEKNILYYSYNKDLLNMTNRAHIHKNAS